MPLVLYLPDQFQGMRVTQPVSISQVYATLVALGAGAKAVEELPPDTRESLLHVLWTTAVASGMSAGSGANYSGVANHSEAATTVKQPRLRGWEPVVVYSGPQSAAAVTSEWHLI